MVLDLVDKSSTIHQGYAAAQANAVATMSALGRKVLSLARLDQEQTPPGTPNV